jgi:hypothetical protein
MTILNYSIRTSPSDAKRTNDMVISAKAKEKRLAQARKSVKHHERWGWLDAAFEFTIAIFSFAACGIMLYLISFRLLPMFGQNQAAQNAVQIGWLTGAVLGFSSGLLLFKGFLSLWQGIETLRGDVANHILVEYHHALESLVHAENAKP